MVHSHGSLHHHQNPHQWSALVCWKQFCLSVTGCNTLKTPSSIIWSNLKWAQGSRCRMLDQSGTLSSGEHIFVFTWKWFSSTLKLWLQTLCLTLYLTFVKDKYIIMKTTVSQYIFRRPPKSALYIGIITAITIQKINSSLNVSVEIRKLHINYSIQIDMMHCRK